MARTAREDNLALRGALIVELPAGAAVAANDALYLDSSGKVQKLTSAQEDNRIKGRDGTEFAAGDRRDGVAGEHEQQGGPEPAIRYQPGPTRDQRERADGEPCVANAYERPGDVAKRGILLVR